MIEDYVIYDIKPLLGIVGILGIALAILLWWRRKHE